MKLRVWTGRVERVILNVDEETTCREVIFALAAVTKIAGCYTMICRQADTHLEFLLKPSDKPLKILNNQKRFSQPPLRFLLRHSNRSQPITQLAYHERTRGKTVKNTAQFLYNSRDESWGQLWKLRRRNTHVGVPGWWRKRELPRELLYDSNARTKSAGIVNAPPVGGRKNDSYSGRIETSVRANSERDVRAEVGRLLDRNNNNRQPRRMSGGEPESDPIELVLRIAEVGASGGNTSGLKTAATTTTDKSTTTTTNNNNNAATTNTIATTTTAKSTNTNNNNNNAATITATPTSKSLQTTAAKKANYSNRSNEEIVELNEELNRICDENDVGRLGGMRRGGDGILINRNPTTRTDLNGKKCDGDSLERIALDNALTGSEANFDIEDNNRPPSFKPTCDDIVKRKTLVQSTATRRNVDKTHTDAIESLDDFLDREKTGRVKRIPKKLAIETKNFGAKAAASDELSYGEKLRKFRMLEREDKSSAESSTGQIYKYADRVDSEINELKIEVQKNELAAEKLQSSIKQMETNFNGYNYKSNESVNKSLDFFFYPTEKFQTMTKTKREELPERAVESNDENVTEDDTGTNQSIVAADSFSREFVILLEDNRKGFLV